MAKSKSASLLCRLAGRKVVFSGKFGYGVEDALKAMATAQRAAVLDDLTDKVDYLVLADLSGGKTIQKKATSLNAKGAAIQVIDADAFRQLVKPTEEELTALLKDGDAEWRHWRLLHRHRPSGSWSCSGMSAPCGSAAR